MFISKYRIKKVYDLKNQGTGFFIYSRHILGRHVGPIKMKERNLRRYRISNRFTTRKGAVKAAKNLQIKSDAVVMAMKKV